MAANKPTENPLNGDTSSTREAELKALAKQIRGNHLKIEKALRSSLRIAQTVGGDLKRAKEMVQDNGGAWGRWCKKQCNLSNRQAQKYVQIADGFKELIKQGHEPDKLTINQAVTLLAKMRDKKKSTGNEAVAPGNPEKPQTPYQMSEEEFRTKKWEAQRFVDSGKITFTEDTAEGKFVREKVQLLAEQIRKQAAKLCTSHDPNNEVQPIHLAIALIERVSKVLDANIIIQTQEPKKEVPAPAPEVTPAAAPPVALPRTEEPQVPSVPQQTAPALTEPATPAVGNRSKNGRHKRNGKPVLV